MSSTLSCTRHAGLAIAVIASVALPLPAQPRAHAGTPSPVSTPASARLVTFSRVSVATGVTLSVAQSGDPAGVPVLFLHGYSDSWFSWSTVAERLPRGMRAIMLDQRGHGRSDKPGCCYRLDDMAADALALLDALGIEHAAVVGHSMGSFVAQRVAVRAPGRVTDLVLVASAPVIGVPAVVELNAAVQSFGDTIPAAFIREFQVSTIHGTLPPGFLDRVLEESGMVPAHAWKALALEFVADSVPVASRIRARTLVIGAELDAPLPPELAERLAATVPGASYIEYAKTGHAIHWEQPARFVSDLLQFIRGNGRW